MGCKFTLPVTDPLTGKLSEAPRYNPYEMQRMLANIPRDHARAMGFRPEMMSSNDFTSGLENLMVSTLEVPSSAIRFPLMANEGSKNRGEDDATLKLVNILKLGEKLLTCLEKEKVKDIKTDLRCFHAEYNWVLPAKTEHDSPTLIHCECNEPWPSNPSSSCPCITNPGWNKKNNAANKKNLVGITGTYVRYTHDKKDKKREKTSLDYWHDIQTELFLYKTGENKKCTISIHGMGKSEKSRYGRVSNGIRGLQQRLKNKKGRIRANVMGNRQDFSGMVYYFFIVLYLLVQHVPSSLDRRVRECLRSLADLLDRCATL